MRAYFLQSALILFCLGFSAFAVAQTSVLGNAEQAFDNGEYATADQLSDGLLPDKSTLPANEKARLCVLRARLDFAFARTNQARLWLDELAGITTDSVFDPMKDPPELVFLWERTKADALAARVAKAAKAVSTAQTTTPTKTIDQKTESAAIAVVETAQPEQATLLTPHFGMHSGYMSRFNWAPLFELQYAKYVVNTGSSNVSLGGLLGYHEHKILADAAYGAKRPNLRSTNIHLVAIGDWEFLQRAWRNSSAFAHAFVGWGLSQHRIMWSQTESTPAESDSGRAPLWILGAGWTHAFKNSSNLGLTVRRETLVLRNSSISPFNGEQPAYAATIHYGFKL